eukprot:2985441-Prymnesium_polylepis.1
MGVGGLWDSRVAALRRGGKKAPTTCGATANPYSRLPRDGPRGVCTTPPTAVHNPREQPPRVAGWCSGERFCARRSARARELTAGRRRASRILGQTWSTGRRRE